MLTLIIDYLVTIRNIESPVFNNVRTKNSVYHMDKIQVLYDVIIDDLRRLEEAGRNIKSEEELITYLDNLFETGKLSQEARDKRETNERVLKLNANLLEQYYDDEEYDNIKTDITPIIKQITYVVENPEEAKQDIRTIWTNAYNRIKDIPINTANKNILNERTSRFTNTKSKIDSIRSSAKETAPINYEAIKRAKADYYFNISSLYALQNGFTVKNERWNNDDTIVRVKDILKRYNITSSTLGGRRPKSKKSQRKTRKSRKSKKTRKN